MRCTVYRPKRLVIYETASPVVTDEVRLSHLSAEASRRHDHVALRFLRAGQAGRVQGGSCKYKYNRSLHQLYPVPFMMG